MIWLLTAIAAKRAYAPKVRPSLEGPGCVKTPWKFQLLKCAVGATAAILSEIGRKGELKKPPQAWIASIKAPTPMIFITRFKL
jgi:hypothetical protein